MFFSKGASSALYPPLTEGNGRKKLKEEKNDGRKEERK
jgi:hypothetical protein